MTANASHDFKILRYRILLKNQVNEYKLYKNDV
jgi:hypothetical protein